MGHSMLRYPRPARRLNGTATGQVPFSPLSQPSRLVPRVRRHGIVWFKRPTVSYTSTVRLRPVKRIFTAHQYVEL